jgi:RNA polymerase sigma-70 factor (ECF subfamily)
MSLAPELLRDFVHGDERAFEAVFREYQRDVYRWIVRIVRDPSAAEDVTIETFWRIHRGRARFHTERSFGAWARRIATNAALDHLKRAGRHATRELVDEPRTMPADELTARETRRSIVRAFQALPPALQLTARLALVDERPYQDIADALGVSIGTVKSRVFRATRFLRDQLTRAGLQP